MNELRLIFIVHDEDQDGSGMTDAAICGIADLGGVIVEADSPSRGRLVPVDRRHRLPTVIGLWYADVAQATTV